MYSAMSSVGSAEGVYRPGVMLGGGLPSLSFAVVMAGICNLFRVLAIARLLFVKDTVGSFNIHRLMLADGMPV